MSRASTSSFAQSDIGSLFKQNIALKYGADLAVFPKSNHVTITMGDNTLQFPADTLLILDAFRTPSSVTEAVKRLQPQFNTRADWMRLIETITTLVKLGALVAAVEVIDQPPPPTLALHRLLLRDEYRTQRYLEALRAVVRPTDIVLDIGTGSGVLAAGAVMAGAKHVYAIEASSMAQVARNVFEANGLSDRITVIEGWSTEIELPERADILVSEIISNGIFGQNILHVTHDAVQRLLKPDARLIPSGVRLYGQLAEVSADWLGKQQFTPELVAQWKQTYGIDFSPLLDAQMVRHFADVAGSTAQEWTYLSEPVLLADLDLAHIDNLSVETTVRARTQTSGTVNAVVLYFEADLAPGMTITTNHGVPERPFAWANPVCLFDAEKVEAGQQFDVTLLHSASDALGYTISLRRHDEAADGR